MKLSVYIVTLNEEKRLEKTLQAVQQVADEILIVDSGSTDKTKEIAEKYNAKFIFHKWKNISSQKKFAQDTCENDFVLSLDADEVLSPRLIEEINQVKSNQKYKAYKIKIKDMYPNDKKPKIFAKSYNLVRLYDRNVATMPDDLTHDRVVFKEETEIGQLSNIVYHYSYISLTQSWYKYNMYTDELKKVLTRISDTSKTIVIGHSGQCDLYHHPENSGFVKYIEHFKDEPYAQVCHLTTNHRGIVSTKADEL